MISDLAGLVSWTVLSSGVSGESHRFHRDCEQNRNHRSWTPARGDDLTVSAAYLDKLNPEQRRAVEHGVSANMRRWARLSSSLLERARERPARSLTASRI